MKQRPRIYYTEEQKALMWDRWQQGDTLHAIAKLFDRHHPSIAGILAQTGGIRPAPRRRSRLALTAAEREEISRGLVTGRSIRSIAAKLGRAPSTVSREIRRNGGHQRYRASQADQAAWDRAKRPKTCKLAESPVLARIVARSFNSSGHHSRSPAGSNTPIRMTSTARCHTRPSIKRCLFKRAAP